jgi:uncharacterized phage protein gp47/JayE
MTAPDERRFAIKPRGWIRDNVVLQVFRNHLRSLTNPDTGAAFTEDEIALATQPGSRFYIEADSIDVLGQIWQRRGAWFADQVRPSRANTAFLEQYHGQLWLGDDPRLPATGGSGAVNAPATVGSIFPGSATVPDPTGIAAVATDPNGYRYQVLATVVTPVGGVAELQMQAIDTGLATNIELNTVLTWSSGQPVGAEATAAVSEDPAFVGGYDIETDSELGARIERRIRHRPAGGNSAHFIAWAERASVSIESSFCYPCAFHAGSVLVALLQKRGSTVGPTARTNVGVAVMAAATNYLTPPASPVVPTRVHVLVTRCNPQSADVALKISMQQGAIGGWHDADPWPEYSAAYPEVIVTNVASQTEFTVVAGTELPGGAALLSGADAPQMMLWNPLTSRWVLLDVDEVSDDGGNEFTVTLNSVSSMTIAEGNRLSPYTEQLVSIAEATENYFDELGPGEVVDMDEDTRAARVARYPRPTSYYPYRAGQVMLARLIEALGGVTADAELSFISRSVPDLPGDIADGPNIITLGNLSIFAL